MAFYKIERTWVKKTNEDAMIENEDEAGWGCWGCGKQKEIVKVRYHWMLVSLYEGFVSKEFWRTFGNLTVKSDLNFLKNLKNNGQIKFKFKNFITKIQIIFEF